MLDATIRKATQDDLIFVRTSWFESYRKGRGAPDVGFNVYKPHQDATIEHLLPRSTTLVLHLTAVPEEICAYAVFDETTRALHFLYTKQDYRKQRFATQILNAIKPITYYTHETVAGRSLLARHGARYNPFLLHAAQPKGAKP